MPSFRILYQNYRNGAWTTSYGPVRAGARYVVSNALARVPGTHTIWSVGARYGTANSSTALIERSG